MTVLNNCKLVRVFGLTVALVAFYIYSMAIFDFFHHQQWTTERRSVHVRIQGNTQVKRERELGTFPHSDKNNNNSIILNPTTEHRPDNQSMTQEEDPLNHHQENGPITEEIQEQLISGHGEEGPISQREDDDSQGDEQGAVLPLTEEEDPRLIVKQLYLDEMTGSVNYDVWRWIVGFTVDDMRIVKSFPSSPDERSSIDSLHVEFNETDPDDIKGKYSHKIYGYLLPPTSGDYQFSIEMSDVTAAGCVELWLSNNTDPLNLHKILVLNHEDWERQADNSTFINKTVISGVFQMNSTYAYYFEFLEKAYDGSMVVDIKWKPPHLIDFVDIEPENLAMAAIFDGNGTFIEGVTTKFLDGPLPSDKLQAHYHVHYDGTDDLYPITEVPVLSTCHFSSAYAVAHEVKPLAGGKDVFESRVYPDDRTTPKNCTITGWKSKGNPKISSETVNKLLSLYTNAFKKKHPKGKVVKVQHMEETINRSLKPRWRKKRKYWPIYGSRFLMEMELRLDTPEPRVVHTSEYVYLQKGSKVLCRTIDFQWSRPQTPVDVYFVVAMKNLGVWVDHLIQNMENIYTRTGDKNFELVVVDYDSEDADVEEKLRKSSVNRWHFIKKEGNFSRSAGLQAGIDYVTDTDSIVMTIDMHLTIPAGIVEYVRRHTVRGKMACAPYFFRLNKGYTEININGFWEVYTYGLISMFKSDWIETGGFDLEQYTTNWGGEDWDMVDRIISSGYEIFRIRYPGLVHYYHTKAGMWGVDGAKNRPI